MAISPKGHPYPNPPVGGSGSGGGGGGLVLSDTQGLVIDVSDVHHPPDPSEANAKNIYKDSAQTPPRIWIPHEDALYDTSPSITSTVVPIADNYRGALYANPTGAGDEWFYYNRVSHSWRLRITIQGISHFLNVGWAEIKVEAFEGDDITLFFGANDVFLNEVLSHQQAADIIENTHTYNSAHGYWYFIGGNLYKVDTFTAAVTVVGVNGYVAMNAGYNPVGYWYANGQDEKYPDSFPHTVDAPAADDILRLQFSQDTPNISFYDDFRVFQSIWVDGSNATDVDSTGAPPIATDNVVFSLSEGTYRLKLVLDIALSISTAQIRVELMQVETGADDRLLYQGGLYSTSGPSDSVDALSRIILEDEEWIVEEDAQYYFRIITTSNTRQINRRFNLRLERLP